MNINPDAKVILCYGDSNTYGRKPGKLPARYPSNIRWPGHLQKLLGEDYRVVEEGLRSRTTDIADPDEPHLNGKSHLYPSLKSHNPIDVFVLMLGTNDLKTKYNRSATEVAASLSGLIDIVKANGTNSTGEIPEVMLISPILIDHTAPGFDDGTGRYDEESAAKSAQLSSQIKAAADRSSSNFFDASSVARPGVDGKHMDHESHMALARSLARIIPDL
ncbi:MAG: GDSL-type esterase/lipase family protein [Patescibacteria group bacterium]